MGEVLFEITDEHLETGMRGYPVGYCITSSVDPTKGLFYMGRPVGEMASWSPEETIYLLLYGGPGSEERLKEFSDELNERAGLNPKTVEAIRRLPREGHPMKLFSCALLIAGMFEGTGNYSEDCLNAIAKIPSIVATVINHHAGWGETRPFKPQLGYMENFAQMLNVPSASLEDLTRVLRVFNVLHYDHGGGNLSAFTGKAVASGLADMYASLAAAMDALSGPRHGKANQDCLQFVKEMADELGPKATPVQVEELLRKRLANHKLIFGFGHAVLRVEDPRATVLYGMAEEHYPDDPLVGMALLLRLVGPKVLSENPKIADPYPNVDAISGTLLSASGFPYPEYYTVLFGLSRCVGIARQIVYERTEARGGKGTPIVRPKYYFKEQAPVHGR